MKHRPRMIAPRLANGASRVNFGHGLPEEIKEGLRRIARRENKSMSWVMEEVIIAYFELRPPAYKEKKPDEISDRVKRRATEAVDRDRPRDARA